jgi:hypothetical protein
MKKMAALSLPTLALFLVVPLGTAATITVTTTDNASGPGEPISLDEAIRAAIDGDTIAFNIPGDGPHVIVTPIGGYPLITVNNLTIDGYTQPGSSPNTNPILGGNNAQIRIVLDSTGTDSAPNDPQDPALTARRSTRILHSGYGDSENGMLAVLGGDNFTVKGISFVARHTPGSTDDPSIYAVALVNQATNARVQGCWFGLPPGGSAQTDLKPAASAVAAFRYRTGGDVYSAGLVVGTDGDGVSDRAEFNVILGSRIGLAIEAPRLRVSGNYFNVFPDGNTFVDVEAVYAQLLQLEGGESVENIENGRVTEGTIIGTNGDGISDSDERNIMGHAIYDHDIEFYSDARNAVVAGNYFGVGVDGVTTSPVLTSAAPDLLGLPGSSASIRVGSNGDGISDDLEGNLIVNLPGTRFVKSGDTTPIVARRNKMMNDNFKAVPFADGENGTYAGYYTPYLLNAAEGAVPVLLRLTNGVLSGTLPAPNATYPNKLIDLYTVDSAALAKTNFWPAPMVHPMNWLRSITDNGPGDLNPNANEFSIDVSGFGLSDTSYVSVTASYSQIAALFNGTNAVTSPMSNPISARPTLKVAVDLSAGTLGTVTLSWLAAEGIYELFLSNNLGNPDGWISVFGEVYTGGRNVATLEFDPFSDAVFYKLVAP